jgi:putative DNA primase/helicase
MSRSVLEGTGFEEADRIFNEIVEVVEKQEFSQSLETSPHLTYIPREILRTDRGNLYRLLNREFHNIIYVEGLGFCIWNGQKWETNADYLLQSMIMETHGHIIDEMDAQNGKEAQKKLYDWIEQSNNSSRIKAVEGLLKKEARIRKKPDDLDQNDWLINLQNGTFNLKTYQIQDFNRKDYITHCLPFDYDPLAKCPQWEQFISQILTHKEEAEWLQRIIGYTLTGETSAQFFLFLFGVGGNGKGILLQTLLELMGSYGCSLPPESFMLKYNDGGVPNDIAGIRGARLVVGTEVPHGRKWNETLLKQLTGSDPVKARYLHKEYFTFYPKCKIWISGNPRPAVSDSGNAFWRRLKLIEFKQKFDKPDLKLGEKLKKELPGIFNWAIKGLKEASSAENLSLGLEPPQTIKEETEMYKMENDTLARFLDDCCDKSNDFQVGSHKLYTSYMDWAKHTGELSNILNSKEFPKKMIEKGFLKKRSNKGWVYSGLAINDKKDAGLDSESEDTY